MRIHCRKCILKHFRYNINKGMQFKACISFMQISCKYCREIHGHLKAVLIMKPQLIANITDVIR